MTQAPETINPRRLKPGQTVTLAFAPPTGDEPARFVGLSIDFEPGKVAEVLAERAPFDAGRADELGLCTVAPDAIDWEDELRLALEERASFSPDALTGMEANIRFAGPETMETRIFGRLSAWQNWIFQRPNAVGERGALKCYGTPNRPEFDLNRT